VEHSDDEPPTLDLKVASEEAETVTLVDDWLAPGTNVSGYIIDGALGSGGMGVVYSATHPVIGKRAAIKVLKPDLSRNHDAVERFALEARAVNQIGHPNIVDIFAFGALPDGRSYYVMDLLAGETLRRRIKRGPVHVSEAAHVIDEIASALVAAHAAGIIHRDLKPDNVFVVTVAGRPLEVKLLDWGLAKLAPALGGKARTLAGSVLGTPVYMSPEQARASPTIDHRTDIYALGVISYELLTGQVPFQRGSSIDTLLAHQDEPVPPLLARVPMLPEELAQLIEAMLAKEADDRPTLAAVRAVIKRLKGTKIPTLTAAGVSMPQLPLAPAFEIAPPSLSPPTIDLGLSQEVTSQRLPRPPTPLPLPPPSPSNSMPAAYPPPSYSMPHMYPPDPRYSSPSMQMAPPVQVPQPRSRSWLVIAIAAVVCSAIGIVIAMLI
jgi:serine/threonine-protein kinase